MNINQRVRIYFASKNEILDYKTLMSIKNVKDLSTRLIEVSSSIADVIEKLPFDDKNTK